MGIPALRIISVSFLPATIGFILPTMFQSMGQGRSFADRLSAAAVGDHPADGCHPQRALWPDGDLGQLYPGRVSGCGSCSAALPEAPAQ